MSRFADFAIYIAIGLTCVGAAIALAEYTDLTENEVHSVFRWVRFSAITAIVFVVTAIGRKPYFRHPSFWGLLFAFLAVHCVFGGALVARSDDWTVWWTLAAATVEGMVLDVTFRTLGFPSRAGKKLIRQR